MAVKKYSEDTWEEVRTGVFRKIVYLKDIMTVIFEFRNGPWNEADPYHSHTQEQTCYIAKGEIILYCEGEADRQLCEGDLFYIPSGVKHTIKVISPIARLVDSFSPVREDFL
ncbi:MAG TPA: cupin domain-containing protein [Prolixibacteraceae bacterium]|jgi:quercetin dioxygenase-like cupin family protein